MEDLAIEIVGYSAAITTTISIYPQAYEVYIIINSGDYEKLNGISVIMYVLKTLGSVLWLVYSCYKQLYPIMFGSIISSMSSIYIVISVLKNRPNNQLQNQNQIIHIHDDTIVVSSSSLR